MTAPFTAVPRRPRSARPPTAPPHPHMEAPAAAQHQRDGRPGEGGDAGGAASDARPVVPSRRHDSPAAVSVSFKEPKSPRRSGGADRNKIVDQAGKKQNRRRAEEPVAHAPAPSQQKDGGPAALTVARREAPSSSSRGAAGSPVRTAEEERRCKGKMIAIDESPPRTSAAAGQGQGKLMGDAIRSHASATAAAPTTGANTKKRKHRGPPFWVGMGSEGQSTSSAGSDMGATLDTIPVASGRLRAALRGLAALPPVRVYGKMMSLSDRVLQQSRLLMSCKGWGASTGGEPFPLDAALTDEEKATARRGKGLPVLTLDRGGRRYQLSCKYLNSNLGYRLITSWSDFLRGNGLVEKRGHGRKPPEVMIDMWLFRTHEGKLGMVLMHYRKGDAAHADAALDEERERRRTRRRDEAEPEDGSTPEHGEAMREEDMAGGQDVGGVPMLDGGDVVMEDAVGDASGEEEEAVPGEAGTPSTLDADGAKAAAVAEEEAGSAQGKAVAPLSSSDGDGSSSPEEEEEAGALVEAAATTSPSAADGAMQGDEEGMARLWSGNTREELGAAHALVMLSKGFW
ncbi:hypothetical protein ACP70R_032051 [Stipagrostis hirtigluma subsp. patula]